ADPGRASGPVACGPGSRAAGRAPSPRAGGGRPQRRLRGVRGCALARPRSHRSDDRRLTAVRVELQDLVGPAVGAEPSALEPDAAAAVLAHRLRQVRDQEQGGSLPTELIDALLALLHEV